jgi:hypothetical protein
VSWWELYKALEVVQNNVGEIPRAWASKAKVRLFERTANHQLAAGLDARHATSKKDPPPKPMPLDDARQLIRRVVSAWLAEKA